ncbi:MAG: hypothetical protein HGA19_14980 [Oscillochloris sp.]|nr:hypothetical protein [Oscillochloris sp.]
MAMLLTTLRSLSWRRFITIRWLIVAGALVGALGIGGLLALRVLRAAPPTQILPGQNLASDIAHTIVNQTGVLYASGSYIPGDSLILYTRFEETELSRVRSWALVQLEPFAERLAIMPVGETLTWVIDYGPDPVEQEVLLAPLRRAREPAFYRYVSSAPMLLGAPTAIPTAAAAVPISAPAPVPTAATVATANAAVPVTNKPTASTTKPSPSSSAVREPSTAPSTSEELLATSFDDGTGSGDGQKSPWIPLAGEWVQADNIYAQRNQEGFDYLSLLDLPVQSDYSVETKLRLVAGAMGGGIIYNAPNLTTRGGAQIVDLDKQGAFVRWGHYEEDGTYRFDGGADLNPPLNDKKWHTMRVDTHGATSTISIDDQEIDTIDNISTEGYVGLSSSQAEVEFDDMSVRTLPAEGDQLTKPTAVPTAAPSVEPISSRFSDDFADGNAQGWQVLGGTWQVLDNEYQQTSTDGVDLASVSSFSGKNYSASIRLRQIDGEMRSGLIFNMNQRDSKARSQIVNFTQGGTSLQWGHFDEGGNFVFEGSAELPKAEKGAWHTLQVRVADGKVAISLDDEEITTDIDLTYNKGYVGLIASGGSAAFDDIQIVAE